MATLLSLALAMPPYVAVAEERQVPDGEGVPVPALVAEGDDYVSDGPVEYVDESGSPQTAPSCVDLNTVADEFAQLDGWYVANGDISFEYPVTVMRSATIILSDNCNVHFSDGIRLIDGGQLTVYGQTEQSWNSGHLNAYSTSYPAIECTDRSTLSLYGGIISATVNGERGAAAIGADQGCFFGTISIGGGAQVYAKSAAGSGIGDGNNATQGAFERDITISGKGTYVNANAGGSAAGIGGGANGSKGARVFIKDGATVEATGGRGAAGIGSGDHCPAAYVRIGNDAGDGNCPMIIAVGGEGAAGIGGGTNATGPDATVVWIGSPVNIQAKGSMGGAAIGGAYDSDKPATIDLVPWNAVYVEDEPTPFAQREDALSTSDAWVGVHECYPHEFAFEVSDAGHRWCCKWCVQGRYGAETPHSFDEAGVCTECGYKRETVEPQFQSANLTVGQQVGLTFWLNLPEADGLDYGESYVELTVDDRAGRTERVDLTDETPTDEKGRRGFAIDLTSVEMAEPVTATFHYADGGEEKAVDLTYSVRQYFEDFDAQAGAHDEKTVALVHATADLGHFMQPYLSAANGWAVGDDYEEMGKHYREMNADDVAAAKAGVSDHRISGSVKGSGIKGVGAQLSFGALTGIDVYLTPEDASAQVTASAVYGGRTFPAVKQADGRWLVRVEGIKPYDFGQAITGTGNGGKGAFTVSVSVLGVANVDLSGAGSAERDQAYASAYYLWKAAQEA